MQWARHLQTSCSRNCSTLPVHAGQNEGAAGAHVSPPAWRGSGTGGRIMSCMDGRSPLGQRVGHLPHRGKRHLLWWRVYHILHGWKEMCLPVEGRLHCSTS